MSRRASGSIVLRESFDGQDAPNPDVILWIYIDAATKPTQPSSSAGVPVGWSSTAPTSLTNDLYASVGRQTAGVGNYVWSDTVKMSGNQGTNGNPGERGPARFNGNIASTAHAVGSAQFITDAATLVSAPVQGDVVVIDYTLETTTPRVRAGKYDGTVWNAFSITIDGSLLIEGTVVADELMIGNSGGFFVDSDGNLTVRSITVAPPPTFVNSGTYGVGRAVTLSSVEYICTNRDGCLATDLATTQPTGTNVVNGWAVFN